MQLNITPQTQAKAHALAKEVYQDVVEGYVFDGKVLNPAPAVALRDTIISRIAGPDELLRLKLNYGEDGPDDRWRASAEALGEHGRPSYGAFNHEQFKLCQKVYNGYRAVRIPGEELSDCESEDIPFPDG